MAELALWLRTTRAWTELEPLREARAREALPIEPLRNGLQELQRRWSHTDDGTWPAAEREAWFALMQRLALEAEAPARAAAPPLLLPTAAELEDAVGDNDVAPNRETGSWGSAAEYAATHAALVRLCAPLRAALRQVRAGELPPRECRMWAGVTIGAAAVGEPALFHRLQLTDEQHAEQGRRPPLLNGALLLVSADGFRRVRPAVIARREASRQLGTARSLPFHDDNLVDPREPAAAPQSARLAAELAALRGTRVPCSRPANTGARTGRSSRRSRRRPPRRSR